ncbi:MAG: LysE family translocator [Spirochaetes bacterium]|nr:MAG: LysE family translocator [Spirochaetota bacterium]
MIEADALAMFVTASTLLAFAPGPDNIFVVAQSMVYGRGAGLRVTLGLCTGLLVHTAVVALGVAAIFRTSVIAFNALKYAGAAYLLFLAWKSFRASAGGIDTGGQERLSGWKLYRRGIIMNVTNPKVSIFFLAFLPQFAGPAGGSITLQLVALGAVFIAVTLVVFGFLSMLAGTAGRWIARSGRGEKILNRIAGAVFVSLAVKLILTERD